MTGLPAVILLGTAVPVAVVQLQNINVNISSSAEFGAFHEKHTNNVPGSLYCRQ
jgi:hypothetical protein